MKVRHLSAPGGSVADMSWLWQYTPSGVQATGVPDRSRRTGLSQAYGHSAHESPISCPAERPITLKPSSPHRPWPPDPAPSNTRQYTIFWLWNGKARASGYCSQSIQACEFIPTTLKIARTKIQAQFVSDIRVYGNRITGDHRWT